MLQISHRVIFPSLQRWEIGCDFKNAMEIQVALKTALLEPVYGSFQKYFKWLYEHWEKCLTIEGQHILKLSHAT